MTYNFKAITHNIAGGVMNRGATSGLSEVLAQIVSWAPDVVFIQEACETQCAYFKSVHPDWAIEYTTMRTDHPDCGPGPQGQILASKWPMSDVVRTDLGWPDGPKQFTFTAATLSLPGGKVRVGTSHLRAFGTIEAIQARKRQTQRIMVACAPYIDADMPVVMGGDFNSTPKSDAEDFTYGIDVEGLGDFYEADQSDSTNASLRDGPATIGNSKFDYIFFSKNATVQSSLSGGVIASTTSDHSLFRGRADITLLP